MRKIGEVLAALVVAATLSGFTTPVKAQGAAAPIYEPLVDRDSKGFKEEKYQKDLAFCRNRAAPQEQAVRAGSQQAASGSALSSAGSFLQNLPIPGLRAAQSAAAGGSAASATGDAANAQGTATASNAMQDYVLVVNSCLARRGYVLLR
jgi:hypothetical protein